MLKQRIITALILATIVLAGIFYLDAALFSVFIGLIVILGAWEWARLSGYDALAPRAVYSAVIAAVLYGLYELMTSKINDGVLVIALVWWLVAFFLVKGYPHKHDIFMHRFVRLLMGALILVPTWVGLFHLKTYEQANWLILYVFGIVWVADIGAYFSGKAFGRRKLAPDVSPGKTWEGVAGGVLATTVLAITVIVILGRYDVELSNNQTLLMFAVTFVITLVSVLGDLLESMVKRFVGRKDSSRLLPGHGGVLDRIDSLTAAVPLFALAVSLSNWTLF